MILSIGRRIGVFLLTVFVASLIIFLLLSVVPGDPAQVALGVTATPEALAAQRAAMGLDQSLLVQYLDWIGGLLAGDFGTSPVTNAPIGAELLSRLGITTVLVLCGMAVALIIAVPLGVVAAVRRKRPDGVLLSALSQVGIAVPAFLAGLLLITVFAVQLRWLPAGGWARPDEGLGSTLAHLLLPVVALGFVQAAVISRYVRSSVLDVMQEDYLRTARGKGFTAPEALVRHGLRNAAIPVLTISGVQLGHMLIGAVVVEKVFVINGLGSMLLEKAANRDMLAVQGIVMVVVTAVLLINLVVDVLYTVVDPRLREASS
ncbi:ABC transporter permease [Prauserella cavernicola]|uniref:ABC transporter permease n=1 Tax=Prauserella cavernicola TaxID=2800127 RepID=A0A934V8Y2_9PSEU|nr:ABC transporter permease [Prauserella cavernicola]MBK1789144.1 ABC transporter permease [Prauserella cavernicola]